MGDNLTDAYDGVGPAFQERPDAPVLILGGTPSLSLLITSFAVSLDTGPGHVRSPRFETAGAALGATVIEGPLPDRVEQVRDRRRRARRHRARPVIGLLGGAGWPVSLPLRVLPGRGDPVLRAA